MLHDLLAIAWLISGAILLFVHFSRQKLLEQLFQVETLPSRVIQSILAMGLIVFAISGLVGYPCSVIGMPMLHWFSLLFLINLWFRAAFLLTKNHSGTPV